MHCSGAEPATVLENEHLKVTYSDQRQTLTVLDKRTGRNWEQLELMPPQREVIGCPLITRPAPGLGLESWEGAVTAPIGDQKVFNQGTVGSQASGVARLMRDEDNLYVRVDVTDNVVVATPADQEKFWESDGVELWMGTSIVTFTITAPDSTGGQAPRLLEHWSTKDECPSIKSELFLTDSGYVTLLAIPLGGIAKLSDAASTGGRLAFAVGINNADVVGTRKAYHYFPAGFRWNLTGAAELDFGVSTTPVAPDDVVSPPRVLELLSVDAQARTLTLRAQLPGLMATGEPAPAQFRLEYALNPTAPDLTMAFSSEVEGRWDEVLYPYVFSMTEPDSFLLFPHSEGLLAPLHKNSPDYLPLGKDYIYSGYGPYCACLGLVNLSAGDGVLTLFPDPELAGYEMVDVGADAVAPRLFWRANKHQFDRPRRVIFSFQDKGGYVGFAKRYQQFFKDTGAFRTLAEKARELPAVNQLVGAPIFWVYDRETPAELLEVCEMMQADGLDRALIEVCMSYYYRMEGCEPKAVELEGIVKKLRDMNYVVSRYDQYREACDPAAKASVFELMNTEGYPDSCLRREDGELQRGWYPLFLLNLDRALELAKTHLPPDLKRYAYNARFIDCIGTCVLWDGEDWDPNHPLDTYGVKAGRTAIVEYVNSCGLVAGTEGAVDYVLPYMHWLETPMSLVKWTAASLSIPGVGLVEDFPEYQVSIGTKYRIPFYSLVHHSEVSISWRYEDSFHRMPQYWQDKNLWSVLYGNPPLFFLDLPTYKKNREAIAHTYQYVCHWTKKVGHAEMVSHRFVSPDRTVQETVFSTGDGVVVNFGKGAYVLPDGQTLSGRSYLTFKADEGGAPEGAASKRTYAPPPVPEMDYEQFVAAKGAAE